MPMKKIFTFYVNHFYASLRSTFLNNDSTNFSEAHGLYKAPEKCVDNIMSFAQAYDSVESENVGTVEMIMN
jgi:hypothetical protein